MRVRLLPLLLCALVPASCNPLPAPRILGHVHGITGADKDLVRQEIDGISLALADHAALTREDPQARPFVVRHADDHGDREMAEAQAVRLASVNRAVALLGSQDLQQVQRLTEAAVPVIAPVPFTTSRMRDSVVALGLVPEVRAKALVSYLRDRVKPTSVVLLADRDDEDSRRTEEAFADAWKEAKAEAPIRERIPGDAQGLDALLQKAPPNALLVVFTSPAALRADLARGYFGNRPFAYGGIEVARQHLRGHKSPLYLVTAFAPGKHSPRAEDFARAFQEKFKTPAEPHAALAYECTRLAIELVGKAVVPPSKLRDEMLKLKAFQGLHGSYAIDGLTLQRPAFVGRWDDTSLVEIDRYPMSRAME